MRDSVIRRFATWSVVLGVVVVPALGACSDGDDTASTTSATAVPDSSGPPTTEGGTTSVPTSEVPTTAMGGNIESLSYLIQGLLTSDRIGGGWIDQGRQIVPPGSDQLSGFLCEDGESTVRELEGRLDPQVSTTFRRPQDVGLSVLEGLVWGDRDQLTADFASFSTAVSGCAGAVYSTSELGDLRLTVEPPPELGTSALSYRFEPASPSAANPWLEQRGTMVLLSDPAQPIALVVTVGAVTIHDPADLDTTEIGAAEFSRIATIAVERILEGL